MSLKFKGKFYRTAIRFVMLYGTNVGWLKKKKTKEQVQCCSDVNIILDEWTH